MDTQLGSDDSGLCIWTELKQNMKKVRGRHCDNDRLLINSIFMLNEGFTVRHSLEIRTFVPEKFSIWDCGPFYYIHNKIITFNLITDLRRINKCLIQCLPKLRISVFTEVTWRIHCSHSSD